MIKEIRKGGRTRFKSSQEHFRAKLAVNVVCDVEGNNIFNPEKDFELLSRNMGAKKLDKIVTVAQRLSGISDEDMEELEGNSLPDQDGDSISI